VPYKCYTDPPDNRLILPTVAVLFRFTDKNIVKKKIEPGDVDTEMGLLKSDCFLPV
jgi:hypothetical protein